MRRQVIVPQTVRSRLETQPQPQPQPQPFPDELAYRQQQFCLPPGSERMNIGQTAGMASEQGGSDFDFVLPPRHLRARSLGDDFSPVPAMIGPCSNSGDAVRLMRKRSAREADLIRGELEMDSDITHDNFRANKRFLAESFALDLGSLNLDSERRDNEVACSSTLAKHGRQLQPDQQQTYTHQHIEQHRQLSQDGGHELSDVALPQENTPPRIGMLNAGLRRGLTVFDDLNSLENSESVAVRLLSGADGPLPAGMAIFNPADPNVLYREPAAVSALFGTPGTLAAARSAGSIGGGDHSTNNVSPPAFSVGSAPSSSGRVRRNTMPSGWVPQVSQTNWRNDSAEMLSTQDSLGDLDSELSEEFLVYPDGRRVLIRRGGHAIDIGPSPDQGMQAQHNNQWSRSSSTESAMFEME